MAEKTRGRSTAQILADKDKEDIESGRSDPKADKREFEKRKKQQERTKEIIKAKDIEQGLPTEKQKPKESPIQLLAPKKAEKAPSLASLKGIGNALEGRPVSVFGKEIQTGLRGTKEQEATGERTKVLGGTLPIGATGAATTLISGFKGSLSTTTAEAYSTFKSTLGLTKMSGTASNVVRGKLVTIPGQLSSFGGRNAAIASRFATNTKSASLTKKLLIGAGFSLAGASLAKDLFGTYPFASFGKEETLQSVGFVMTQAINAGLYEDAQEVLDASNEIINKAPTLADKIPYANVQKEFQRYITQQRENNKVWQAIIDKKIAENTGESETDFAKERREGDEAAQQRKLEEQALDSQYFQLIRDQKYEEAEELLQSRIKGEE